MLPYLSASKYIDFVHPMVSSKAAKLAAGLKTPEDIARACFEFVRDEIKHSWDYQLNPVTCKASEVLTHGTGFCYAKSHLLAALLRANAIPAGLCYQRLTIANNAAPFCLHGLNAIFLAQYGWYRVDARGNKSSISANFMPPDEQLAFKISLAGEADFPEIWSEPLPNVIAVLESAHTIQDVSDNLPDVEIVRGM